MSARSLAHGGTHMDTQPRDSTDLVQELYQRKDALDEHIDDVLPVEEPAELHAASRHLVDAGGKRLRPVSAMLVAEALSGESHGDIDYRAVPDGDGNEVDIIRAAYSLELVHTFSLIHDDIMDDDPLRRGVNAVHREYGDDTAILSGDYLYARGYQVLLDAGGTADRTVEASRILADTTAELCEGQARDIDFEERDEVTPDEYMQMVRGKTAALYGASAAIPAAVLGADDEIRSALHQFGTDVGMAFQICDDVLDLTGDTADLGKEQGSDLVERKQTLITLHARQQGLSEEEIYPETDDPEDIRAAVTRLKEVGSIDYAEDKARSLIESGKNNLEPLPDTQARAILCELSDFLIERDR